ncbi:MAG: hypothetical protein ABW022_23195 [Actinoplanes sp.]
MSGPSAYPPLNLAVRTPRLTLAAATDDLLERLVPVVRAGVVVDGEPLPFDDPMTLYDDSPAREWGWMRRVWAGRSRVDAAMWRGLRRPRGGQRRVHRQPRVQPGE